MRTLYRSVVLVVLVGAGLGGCSSAPEKSRAPELVAADPQAESRERIEAIDAMWATNKSPLAREKLKDIAWAPGNAVNVRVHAVETLLSDPGDPENKDTRKSMRLRLFAEPQREMVKYLAELAALRRWDDFTAPLIRQYGKRLADVEEHERPERSALIALHPDKTPEQLAFDYFAKPVTSTGVEGDQLARTRDSAWELLSRLDPSGENRAGMLERLGPGGDEMVQDLLACRAELKCLPLTPEQLRQMRRLRQGKNAGWWSEARGAIARLSPEQTRGLALRHAEVVRWAGAHRAELLGLSKSELETRMTASLRGRSLYLRTGGGMAGSGTPGDFVSNSDKMPWGDVLACVVIDEALRTPGIADVLWKQAQRDMTDTSTEYGGLLIAGEHAGMLVEKGSPADGQAFAALVYPPRALQRKNDYSFVASDDMIEQGTLALAHYHFHAQRVDNADQAGPGAGDMEYAITQGVNCLVLTPVSEGVLDADVYFASEGRADLGEVKRP